MKSRTLSACTNCDSVPAVRVERKGVGCCFPEVAFVQCPCGMRTRYFEIGWEGTRFEVERKAVKSWNAGDSLLTPKK